jgi:hypothetical protein
MFIWHSHSGFLRRIALLRPTIAKRGDWKTMKKLTAPVSRLATLVISGMLATPAFGQTELISQ